jgi:hypothetical protein
MGNLLMCFSCSQRVTPMKNGTCPACQKPTRPAAVPAAGTSANAAITPAAAAAPDLNSGGAGFVPYKAMAPSMFERPGIGNVIFGGIMCALGITISVVSYQAAASNPNGGHYVVTWGLVVFGGIRVVKGLAAMFG